MNQDTSHSELTEHGYLTPYSFPLDSVDNINVLNNLSTQLYPTGRAWYKPELGVFEKLHESINVSFVRFINDGKLFIDGIFPDNENFTSNDATLWEDRLGLTISNSVDLESRKKAIYRKMGYPNNVKTRQNKLFIETQLQLAGFNVFVHENISPYQDPYDIAASSLTNVQHGGLTQHGNSTQHGGDGFELIANSVEENEIFAIGGEINLWASFFIGGENLGDIAIVPHSRMREFKELVIKLKPAHLVAFTFINYI